jgi:hypothetical protein
VAWRREFRRALDAKVVHQQCKSERSILTRPQRHAIRSASAALRPTDPARTDCLLVNATHRCAWCGHTFEAHEHLHRRTYCSICDCTEFVPRRWWHHFMR